MSLRYPPPANPSPVSTNAYVRIERSPEFRTARSSLYRFVRTATIFFLAWYGLYVLLGTFATGFMATPVFGSINIGLLLGLAQFLSTFVITGLYVRFTNRRLPELVERIDDECGAR